MWSDALASIGRLPDYKMSVFVLFCDKEKAKIDLMACQISFNDSSDIQKDRKYFFR